MFSYNTAKQESTLYSPFELLYARQPVLPVEAALPASEVSAAYDIAAVQAAAAEARKAAVAGIEKRAQRDKQRYDKKGVKSVLRSETKY